MGFFKWNMQDQDDRPDITPDTPRKKGAARFAEILLRDGMPMIGSNLLLFLAVAVGAVMTVATHSRNSVLLTAFMGGVAFLLVAPFLCGLNDLLLRSLRDEPGFWWYTYKKNFMGNARASMLPGFFFGFITAVQLDGLFRILYSGTASGATYVAMGISLVLTVAVQLYFWPQLVLMDLNWSTLFKNSVLLVLLKPLRTLGTAVLVLLYWYFILFLFPKSIVWLLFVGFGLLQLFCLMMVYPTINSYFGLEERIRDRKEKERGQQEKYKK